MSKELDALLDAMLGAIPQHEKERLARQSTDQTFDALELLWKDKDCTPAQLCENMLMMSGRGDMLARSMSFTVLAALINRSLQGITRERFLSEMRTEVYNYTIAKLASRSDARAH